MKLTFILTFAFITTLAVIVCTVTMIDKYHFKKNSLTVCDYIFSHDFEVNQPIELSDFLMGTDAYDAFKAENYGMIRLIDEHTVLIMTEAFLVSAEGILITDGTEITEDEVIVPGFDGDKVRVSATDDERIYEWFGGI